MKLLSVSSFSDGGDVTWYGLVAVMTSFEADSEDILSSEDDVRVGIK